MMDHRRTTALCLRQIWPRSADAHRETCDVSAFPLDLICLLVFESCETGQAWAHEILFTKNIQKYMHRHMHN